MDVYIELFFTNIQENKVVYDYVKVIIEKEQTNPDAIVREIATKQANLKESELDNAFIIHSTSWRYNENNGQEIILTYILYSDNINITRDSAKTLAIDDLHIAINTRPAHPSPNIIRKENVLAHALRHLSFLIVNDKEGDFKKLLKPETIIILKNLYGMLAGELTTKLPK